MNGKLLTRLIVFVMALVSIFAPRSSFAQDETNLLRNPGWEGGYHLQDGIPELAVPLGWRLHYLETTWPQGKGPAHRPETVVWYIEQAPLEERPIFWVDGIYTLKIFKGGAPVYSGLSQDLDNLQVGARYRFTVPLYADIVEAYTDGRKIPPAGSEQAGVRLGVSKHGASWRDEGQITYSGWFNSANTPNFYLNRLNYVYNFVATDTKITVWVEMFGADFLINNGFFLDGLSLVKTGNAPTVTPRPTNTRVPATATSTPRPTVAPTAVPTFAPTDYPTATPYPTNTPLPTNTPRPTATPLPTGPWYTKTPTAIASAQPLITPSETDNNEGNDDGTTLLDGGNVSSIAFLPPTSTPDAEGVIYGIVGAGDSLWSVAAKNGLTLDQIKELNDLPLGDANVFVSEGQKLIVGRVAAATATPEPTVAEASTTTDTAGESADPASTPQPVTPTATVQTGGSICLRAFEDTNQNGTFDAGETARIGVAFTILKGDSVISNYVTTGQDLFCIPGLAASTYRVTRSKGNDEALTTGDEATINLEEGAVAEVSFGSVDAQPTATPVATTIAEANTATSNTPSSETPASGPARGLLVAVGVAASLLLLAVLVILLSRRSAD